MEGDGRSQRFPNGQPWSCKAVGPWALLQRPAARPEGPENWAGREEAAASSSELGPLQTRTISETGLSFVLASLGWTTALWVAGHTTGGGA